MSTALASDVDVLQRVGTALADTTRRRMLTLLLAGPAYPAELAEVLEVSRAKVSNHLACLRGCELVRATREGRQVRYELSDDRLAAALRELAQVVLDSVDGDQPCTALTSRWSRNRTLVNVTRPVSTSTVGQA